MDDSQGNSQEDSQSSLESQKTPKKDQKTPKRRLATPRKQKCPKTDTKGMKALPFFDEVGTREEDGVQKLFYVCQLCHREIVGSNPSNLASHLYHKHRSTYVDHIGDIDEPIQIKRLKLIQNCVSIVALGGRPFTMLMDYGFQAIIAKQLKEFELAGHPLNLKQECQPEVHEYLHRAASLVRGEIKNKIKGRAISIQVDMASRLRRSVFGIDIQYVDHSNIIIHNIGMIVLDKAHTAENLLQSYRKCLQLYDIKRTQVVSISADNGKDVQKMIRLEKENADGSNEPAKKKVARQLDGVAGLYEQSEQTNDEIIAVLNTEEPSDDDAIDMIFSECDIDLDQNPIGSEQAATILRQTMQQISSEHGHNSFDLSGIRCAAHTLQLVVKDALATLPEETKNIILLCRRVAKILRLESTKYFTEGTGLVLKKPRLDVDTRWGSTYVMMVEVINLQKIIEHIALKAKKKKYDEFPLLLQKWRILKEIVYILKIPYDATIALQNRKLTLSDTFGIWLQVKLHLRKVIDNQVSKTDLDVKLLEGITNRNEHLFDHPAMKAAIYLDPRYRSVVTQNSVDVDEATVFIMGMKQRLNHLKDQVVTNETITVDDEDSDDSIGVRFDAEAAINEYLGINQTILSNNSDFNAEVEAFDPPPMGIKESVLEYWNGPSNSYDSLRDVANAIFGIPPTETEVERDFSALKFIFSDLRAGLTNKTLEDILCIHLNKEVYLEVNQREIAKLEESLNK